MDDHPYAADARQLASQVLQRLVAMHGPNLLTFPGTPEDGKIEGVQLVNQSELSHRLQHRYVTIAYWARSLENLSAKLSYVLFENDETLPVAFCASGNGETVVAGNASIGFEIRPAAHFDEIVLHFLWGRGQANR
jgi:hypothetical protein